MKMKKIKHNPVRNVRKSITTVLVAIIGLATAGALVHAATTTSAQIYLLPNSGTYTVGSDIAVAVRETGNGAAVNSVQLGLHYSTTLLQFTSIDATGSAFSNDVSPTTQTPGEVVITRFSTTNTTTDSLVATIHFKALASGTAAVAFTPSCQTTITGDCSGLGAGGVTIPITTTDGSFNLLSPTPPTVTISAPTSGATVSGSTVSLSAAASDTIGIANVQFKVDGTAVGTAITTAPYTMQWDSNSVADGSHTITAIATNTSNLTTTSSPITVTVANHVCSGTPPAPTNVVDTDTSSPLPANKVDLSWTGVAAPINCTLAGYNIYRGLAPAGLVKIAGPVTTTTFTDSTVSASTAYNYQVTAVDTSGPTPESAKAPATPLAVTTGPNCTAGSTSLPSTPTLTATSNSAYTSIPLSWTASTVNNGCALAGYHVFRVGTTAAIFTGTTTSFTDTGIGLTPANLLSGTSYSYFVQAFDSGGNVSTNSATIAATTKVDNIAPTTPTGLSGTAPTSSSVNLSWTGSNDLPNPGAVGVSNYLIFRNDSLTPTYTVASTSSGTITFTDSNVSPSTTYKYSVAAADKNGNQSSLTVDISVTTPAPPPSCTATSPPPSTPTNLTSPSQTMNSISLSWTASTPGAGTNCTITGYQIYNTGVLVNTVTGTTYTDVGLSPNTSYPYMVVAVQSNGGKSNAANLTQLTKPDTQAPSAPTNFIAIATSASQVTLGWTASTDNVAVTKYVLTRGTQITTLGMVTSYVDNTVTASTAYTYSLIAFDAAGNPSTAATVSVTTPAPACSGNPSTPGNLAAPAIASTSVALTWNASTPAAGCSIAGYKVFRGTTSLTPNLVSTASYTDTGLTPFTSYSYTVVAVDTSGHSSSASTALTVKTLTSSGCTVVLHDDLNNDCLVNFNDLALFVQDYRTNNGNTVPINTGGDLDSSGHVDFNDLAIFAQYYTLESGL